MDQKLCFSENPAFLGNRVSDLRDCVQCSVNCPDYSKFLQVNSLQISGLARKAILRARMQAPTGAQGSEESKLDENHDGHNNANGHVDGVFDEENAVGVGDYIVSDSVKCDHDENKKRYGEVEGNDDVGCTCSASDDGGAERFGCTDNSSDINACCVYCGKRVAHDNDIDASDNPVSDGNPGSDGNSGSGGNPDSGGGPKSWPTTGKAAIAIGSVALGGVAAVAAAPVAVAAFGFGSAGIGASTFAASMMSSAAIANGGGVAVGSLVATLQAVGATGSLAAAGAGAAAATGAAGGAAGGGVAGAFYYLGRKFFGKGAKPGNEENQKEYGNEGKHGNKGNNEKDNGQKTDNHGKRKEIYKKPFEDDDDDNHDQPNFDKRLQN